MTLSVVDVELDESVLLSVEVPVTSMPAAASDFCSAESSGFSRDEALLVLVVVPAVVGLSVLLDVFDGDR